MLIHFRYLLCLELLLAFPFAKIYWYFQILLSPLFVEYSFSIIVFWRLHMISLELLSAIFLSTALQVSFHLSFFLSKVSIFFGSLFRIRLCNEMLWSTGNHVFGYDFVGYGKHWLRHWSVLMASLPNSDGSRKSRAQVKDFEGGSFNRNVSSTGLRGGPKIPGPRQSGPPTMFMCLAICATCLCLSPF